MEEVSVLKVRIKFEKCGPVKFVGHLDTMRYFQKAIRRAGIPVAFSGGYSPHMLMSFASPLGVGMESTAEYFDLELKEDMPVCEITERLDREMAEGFRVTGTVRTADGKGGKAMSLVAAADYHVRFREGKAPREGWEERAADFLAQGEILVQKETKNGPKQVDIRPFIYEMRTAEEGIFLKLASASSNYTRPDTVMNAFFSFLCEEQKPCAIMVKRLEVYADLGDEQAHKFAPLDALGEEP